VFNKVPEELKLELSKTLSAILLSFSPSPSPLPVTASNNTALVVSEKKQKKNVGLGEMCSAASMGWWITAMLDYATKEKNRDLK
jgi:hypothetical protein